MDSLTSGSFGAVNSWTSGLIASACTHSGCDKQHYHRHCGCAFHSIGKGFKGSPSCAPSCRVKVSGAAPSGGLYRSVSVQNLAEKHGPAASCGHLLNEEGCASRLSSCSRELDAGLRSFSSSLSLAAMDQDDSASAETVSLVEELANFIHVIKEERPRSSETETDDLTTKNEDICNADEADVTSYSGLLTALPYMPAGFDGVPAVSQLTGAFRLVSSMLLGESFESSAFAVPLHDHLGSLGVSSQYESPTLAEVPQRPKPLITHRRMRSVGV